MYDVMHYWILAPGRFSTPLLPAMGPGSIACARRADTTGRGCGRSGTRRTPGHEEPWYAYLRGDNPGYPSAILAAAHAQARRRDRSLLSWGDDLRFSVAPARSDIVGYRIGLEKGAPEMGARWNTGRLLRIFAAPLLLGGVLTGLGSTAATAATAPACQAWTGGQPLNPNDTGSGDSLGGVAMLSACNVWVAGVTGDRHTLIEHWTGGSTWTVVPSPSPGAGFNDLTAIHGISATDIWAVGTASNADGSAENGLILHWNGTRWLQTPSPNPGTFTQLTGVHEISARDAWAVGTYSTDAGIRTLTLHWDGTSWTQKPSPNPGPGATGELSSVTATSGGDVWAVGDFISNTQVSTVSTLIMHWDGTSWKQTASPNPEPDIINQLTGVSATSPNDAWAVGFFANGTADQTLIMHWDGTSWTQVASPNPFEDDNLSGVAATSAGSAVAVGTGQTAAKGGKNVTLALRWDGTAWTQVPSIQVSAGDFLAGVASISATEAWAVGFSGPTPTKTLAFHFK
jgi:hypothetical protein